MLHAFYLNFSFYVSLTIKDWRMTNCAIDSVAKNYLRKHIKLKIVKFVYLFDVFVDILIPILLLDTCISINKIKRFLSIYSICLRKLYSVAVFIQHPVYLMYIYMVI